MRRKLTPLPCAYCGGRLRHNHHVTIGYRSSGAPIFICDRPRCKKRRADELRQQRRAAKRAASDELAERYERRAEAQRLAAQKEVPAMTPEAQATAAPPPTAPSTNGVHRVHPDKQLVAWARTALRQAPTLTIPQLLQLALRDHPAWVRSDAGDVVSKQGLTSFLKRHHVLTAKARAYGKGPAKRSRATRPSGFERPAPRVPPVAVHVSTDEELDELRLLIRTAIPVVLRGSTPATLKALWGILKDEI